MAAGAGCSSRCNGVGGATTAAADARDAWDVVYSRHPTGDKRVGDEPWAICDHPNGTTDVESARWERGKGRGASHHCPSTSCTSHLVPVTIINTLPSLLTDPPYAASLMLPHVVVVVHRPASFATRPAQLRSPPRMHAQVPYEYAPAAAVDSGPKRPRLRLQPLPQNHVRTAPATRARCRARRGARRPPRL